MPTATPSRSYAQITQHRDSRASLVSSRLLSLPWYHADEIHGNTPDLFETRALFARCKGSNCSFLGSFYLTSAVKPA
jgi:hypothetical protein